MKKIEDAITIHDLTQAAHEIYNALDERFTLGVIGNDSGPAAIAVAHPTEDGGWVMVSIEEFPVVWHQAPTPDTARRERDERER